MTIPARIIEKAVEGGWKYDANDYYGTKPQEVKSLNKYWVEIKIQTTERDGHPFYNIKTERVQVLALDPLFWQALGKALGWEGGKIRMCIGCGIALRWNEQPDMDGRHGGKNGCGSDIIEYEGQWLIEMHRLIDRIAETSFTGGDTEKFWEEIMPRL